MTVELQRGLSATYHEGSQVWVPVVETVSGATADGTNKRKVKHWRRGIVQVSGGNSARQQHRPALSCCQPSATVFGQNDGILQRAAVINCCTGRPWLAGARPTSQPPGNRHGVPTGPQPLPRPH
jgi:hypothetical protein